MPEQFIDPNYLNQSARTVDAGLDPSVRLPAPPPMSPVIGGNQGLLANMTGTAYPGYQVPQAVTPQARQMMQQLLLAQAVKERVDSRAPSLFFPHTRPSDEEFAGRLQDAILHGDGSDAQRERKRIFGDGQKRG